MKLEDPHAHHKGMPSSFSVSRSLATLAIGGAVVAGAVMVAPQVMNVFSAPGTGDLFLEAQHMLSTSGGLAGVLNKILLAVPLIGESLANNPVFNATATAITGVGGMLLANFIEKREDGSRQIKWSKIIRFAALATSALIALPTVLTSLSIGLATLSTLVSNGFANSVIDIASNTLGSIGHTPEVYMGLSGIAAALPHLLTCGLSFVPAALGLKLWSQHQHEKSLSYAQRVQAKKEAADPKLHNNGDIEMDVKVPEMLRVGEECTATIVLRDAGTHQPITEDELAVTHTKKLHMFLVDKSLHDYQHIHPEPTDEPGVYTCKFTPKADNNYSAWLDFTTTDQKNHKLKRDLECLSGKKIAPRIMVNNLSEHDGLQVRMELNEPLQKNEASIAEFTITDSQGKPITDLEPVMGAYAHLVGFPADGKSLIHCHPLGAEPVHDGQRGGPKLRFHVQPETSGPVQFYLQVQRQGQDVMIPFGQRIKLPERTVDRVLASRLNTPSHVGHHL